MNISVMSGMRVWVTAVLTVGLGACAACGPNYRPDGGSMGAIPRTCLPDEIGCNEGPGDTGGGGIGAPADGGTSGGSTGDGGWTNPPPPPTGACAYANFQGKVFSTVEPQMNACYGHWKWKTENEVVFCPTGTECTKKLTFQLSGGVVGWAVFA